MNSYDIEDLKAVEYQRAMTTSAEIELHAMLATNLARKSNNETLAYDEDAFMELINKYGLGHNSIVTTLNPNNR